MIFSISNLFILPLNLQTGEICRNALFDPWGDVGPCCKNGNQVVFRLSQNEVSVIFLSALRQKGCDCDCDCDCDRRAAEGLRLRLQQKLYTQTLM